MTQMHARQFLVLKGERDSLCKQFAGHPMHLTSRSHLQITSQMHLGTANLNGWGRMLLDLYRVTCNTAIQTRCSSRRNCGEVLFELKELNNPSSLRSTLLRQCSSYRPEAHVKHWMFSTFQLSFLFNSQVPVLSDSLQSWSCIVLFGMMI